METKNTPNNEPQPILPTKPTKLETILARQDQIKAEIPTLTRAIHELERQVIPLSKKRAALQAEFTKLDRQRFKLDGSIVTFLTGKKPTKKPRKTTKLGETIKTTFRDALNSMSATERQALLADLMGDTK